MEEKAVGVHIRSRKKVPHDGENGAAIQEIERR